MGDTTQSLARSVLRRVFGRTTIGTLSIRWSDSTTDTIVGSKSGPQASISVADEKGMLRSLVKKGSVGLAESYFDGFWTTDDLATLLEVGAVNLDARSDALLSRTWVHRVRGIWDKRPKQLRSDAIHEMADHYNLGNEFYAMWLDPSMTYSSALYESPDEPLGTAQERKYDRLCQLLDLTEGDRVLEIGCGWGGFAEHAASRYGVHVTGLTLSTEHAKYARQRLAGAGLADRTEIKLQDFRDEKAMYDKVVSIEMIESVDETNWPPLFNAISRALPPGG
ncbi:MAG: class I SAM-dependent methyltransferase, partial [Armatimonadetes bacterium]